MNPKQLFRSMLRIRMVEETIAELYPEQQMRCPVHLSIGQEAVAAGAGAALLKDDYAMSGHRSHAHYLAKGGNLKSMLAELHGKSSGCCGGNGGSMHLIDREAGFLGAVPIVGSTIPIAVGTALTSKMDRSGHVTAAFFGEGATEEGVFHESMNFASLNKLPVVFICENNFYSVYTPMSSRQPVHREVVDQAVAHGMESAQGDGNDVEEVFRLVHEAVERARCGDGPTFLEFKTYRWREHCGPDYDNHIGYRMPQEFEDWKARCPIARAREKLLASGQFSDDEEQTLQSTFSAEIREAVDFAKSSSFPRPEVMTQNLFAA
jgi:pyruvate dehydrogenase E1 component alpha subunit